MQLMTIGYEGLTVERFWTLLTANRIETLIDVREVPQSRKSGFSKSALSLAASVSDMAYIHMSVLGCPREIRYDYRMDKDWARYTKRFLAYLNTCEAALQTLAARVERQRCCLLCFEADPALCHRSYVAERIAGLIGSQLEIIHLNHRVLVPSDPVSAGGI